jgi:hypothetical protein
MSNFNKLEKRIIDLEQRVQSLENFSMEKLDSSQNVVSVAATKIFSAKEFLIQKNPKDDVQRTFYLGGYIEEFKGENSFSIEDLRNAFRSARVPVPDNLNDKVNKNIAKGLFMDAELKEGKKAWILTVTGEDFIKNKSNLESKI